ACARAALGNGVQESFCVATFLGTECPLWVKSGHFRRVQPMSALPPKADIAGYGRDVRFVPKAGIQSPCDLSLEIAYSVMDSVGAPAGPPPLATITPFPPSARTVNVALDAVVQRSAATCSTAT